MGSTLENQKPKEKVRIDYIDAARGIAIFLVVIGHMIPMNEGLSKFIYSFHIPVFFVITGMLLFFNDSWKNKSLKEIFIKKAQGLLYPYITFSILNIIYIIISEGVKSAAKQTFVTVIFDGIFTLWFLPALFLAELAFSVIMKKFKSPYFVYITIAVLVIITYLFSLLDYQSIGNSILFNVLRVVNILNRALIGCIFIFIGYLFGYIKSKTNINIILKAVLTLVAISINVILYRYSNVDMHYSIIGCPLIFYVTSISGSYAVISISELLLKKSKVMSFYGKNSIIIFATHLNFGITVFASMMTKTIFNIHSDIIAFLIVMIIETLLILVINKFAKPLINYKALRNILPAKNK